MEHLRFLYGIERAEAAGNVKIWAASPLFNHPGKKLIKAKKKEARTTQRDEGQPNGMGIERQREKKGARRSQKEPKPKQQRKREPEALGEQEVRQGTKRGLKRHAEAPQQGDEGAPKRQGIEGLIEKALAA